MAQQKEKDAAVDGRLPLNEAEERCVAALLKLSKRYGTKRPPVNEIADEAGYSHGYVSVLLQMLEAKGYTEETFKVRPPF